MINWPKVIEFCVQSWNFSNFAPEFDQICTFFFNLENFDISSESLHFPTFMENKEVVMEKSWNKNVQSLWET